MAPQGTTQASNTLFHPIMPDRGQSLREPLGEGSLSGTSSSTVMEVPAETWEITFLLTKIFYLC